MEVINFQEKEMIPLTDDEYKYYEKKNIATYVKKSFGMIKITKINSIITEK